MMASVKVDQKPSLETSWIDRNAVDIVRALQKAGFTAYLVGGCVRDLLAGFIPKDYDIATNAEPNQVRRKVYGSYVIGRRFRLVLVKRGDQQYEVATFRREGRPEDFAEAIEEDVAPPSADNFFGTPEEDALRRDFTINGLFYDPVENNLIDYCEGKKDIELRMMRMIGEPNKRIKEDPIRSLRAIRLSHKLRFTIEPGLRAAIQENANLVALSVLPRRREEYIKFLRLKQPWLALLELYDLNLIEHLMPTLFKIFQIEAQREIFFNSFILFQKICQNVLDTADLYTPLILAFMDSWPDEATLFENVDCFMRLELGVFKTEQAAIFQAIELQKTLTKVEYFKRKGERRQVSFLTHPQLPLALRIAEADYGLSGKDLMFWKQRLASIEPASSLP